MITVENLSYSIPQKDLYKNVSFHLEAGQHCALIGSNGTGKSTLIDMIMDPDRYLYDGKIIKSENCRIGYVSQFSSKDVATDMTVFDYIAQDFIQIEAKMASICTAMETATDLEPLLEEYQTVMDLFDAMGGADYESGIKRKLNLANLENYEQQPLSNLSGGEYKLVQVIKEMLVQPNLLIMDEPDVFLDFERINALKDLINSHKGTLLVITHNRYLLNHCFNKILHLENTELQEFDGRYIDYNFNLLQTKIELQELSAADDAEIERNLKIVDKMRNEATVYTCASRGRALNARVSILERLRARRVKEPFVEIKQPDIHLTTKKDLDVENQEHAEENEQIQTTDYTLAIKVTDYNLSFEDALLEHVDFEIKVGDKVALIGANGTGKTTLLRELYKKNSPSFDINPDLTVGYFSQIQGEMLNKDKNILEEFYDMGFATYDEIVSYLAGYGFKEEMLNSVIGTLSGGEKNLLQVAKLAAMHADLLLLDEPTSHLDTYSQIALEDALAAYTGTLLMVSHDFYTIVNSVDYVLFVDEKSVRKMSTRKFRKMIYANHFDKDYLLQEEKKKELETRIALALQKKDFESAKELSEQLEMLIKQL